MAHARTFETEPAQIAEILGLPRPASFDALKLVDIIKRGVPAASARHMIEHIDPDGSSINVADLIAKSTLHRASETQKPLSPNASETLWQVARVFVEARRVYREERAALAFLLRPHPLLNDRRPLDLVRETAAGAHAKS
jgi:putative toxin-antitoxin system antitoxin component (TIGR02293 family)